jgi:uncharacterized protein
MLDIDILKRSITKVQQTKKAIETGNDIWDLMEGNLLKTEHGSVFKATATYPFGHKVGKHTVQSPAVHDLIRKWAKLKDIDFKPGEMLFLDTETTGLAGGTGTYVFMVGLGFIREDSVCIEQYFLSDLSFEKGLLEQVVERVRKSKIIVSFNGKSFDTNLLETRCIMQGINFSWKKIPHLDLLPLARRLWKHQLESCALESLEYYILGSMRDSSQDIWGGHIPQVYFHYLDTHNAEEIVNIFNHNRSDILSMPVLLHLISDELEVPHTRKTHTEFDLFAVGRLYEEMGATQSATDIYKSMLSTENMPVKRQLSYLYKREQKLEEALKLWEEAAEKGELFAIRELAIFAEHTGKNAKEALEWVEKALYFIENDSNENEKVLADWNKRKERLLKKA